VTGTRRICCISKKTGIFWLPVRKKSGVTEIASESGVPVVNVIGAHRPILKHWLAGKLAAEIEADTPESTVGMPVECRAVM